MMIVSQVVIQFEMFVLRLQRCNGIVDQIVFMGGKVTLKRCKLRLPGQELHQIETNFDNLGTKIFLSGNLQITQHIFEYVKLGLTLID